MKQLNTMRRLLTGVLAMVFVLGSAGQIDAQIAAWDLTGVSSPATTNATLVNANLASPITLTRGAGAAASNAGNSFRTTGFQNNGISTANTDYFQFTLNPSSGFTMSLSSIDARVNGTSSFAVTPGVSQQYAYSTNGTDFTLIGSPSIIIGTNQFFSVDVSGVTALQEVPEGTTIYIRYYASGQTATGGWGFFSSDGLSVNGTVDVVGYSAQLTGSAGYRLLSSPVEVSLQNFLAPVWTQGATAGADTDAGNPNVFTWNNSATNDDAANWSGVTDLTANLSAGNGVLVYVFQDDVYETPGSFPKTLSVSGTVNTLPVTPTMNSNSGGLTLVGNPIASIISWTALSRTDLSNTVYAWDPNTTLGDGGTDANNPSAGSWKTYNTSIGDLTDGRIHPFQAFFVQTSGNSPVLSIAQGAESTGGSFYGKETAPYAVRLQLDGEAISASKWLSFTGDAEVGRDNSDALQFQPLSLEYSLLASKLTDGTLLDINNLPVDLQETVRFPLIVESTQSGTHTLRVTELNLPTGYEVSILDNVTSLEHPLTLDFELSFELGTVAKNVPTPQNVIASGNLVAKAVEGDDRFELIVSPGTTLSNGILSELPAELALGQNYPNPFNPTTRIAFELPSSQFVKLSVFNMLGQEVSTLLQSEMNAGSHFVNFDASQLSSGVYVYRLEAVGQVITRKMTLVK